MNQLDHSHAPLDTWRGGVWVAGLLFCYFGAALLNVEVVYLHLLLGVIIVVVGLISFEAAFLVVPLALCNPYQLESTGTHLVVSEYVLILMFFLWVLRLYSETHFTLPPKSILVSTLLIVVSGVLSLGGAAYPGVGILQVIRLVETFIVLLVLVVNELPKPDSVRRVVMALVIAGTVSSCIGILQFWTHIGIEGNAERVFGMSGGAYGAIVGTTFCMAISLLLYDRSAGARILGITAIPLSGLALLLSQTRAWIGGTLVALALLFLFTSKKNRLPLLVGGIGTIAFIVIIVQTGGFGLFNSEATVQAAQGAFRFGRNSHVYSAQDVSFLMRLNIWAHSIDLFWAHPLFGVGIGNLRVVNYLAAQFGPPTPNAGFVDNQYLQSFVETGIVGGVAWLFFGFLTIRNGLKAVRSTSGTPFAGAANGLFASIVVFYAGSFFWVVTPFHEAVCLLVIYSALVINLRRASYTRKPTLLVERGAFAHDGNPC